MKLLESVQKAMKLLPGSYINHNNEIILIPKFNVYTSLNDVETDDDFKVKLCEWFSRDCCKALRYQQQKRLNRYYQHNTDVFNAICDTNFTVDNMEIIYTHFGNGRNPELAKAFVKSGFEVFVLKSKYDHCWDGYYTGNQYIYQSETYACCINDITEAKIYTSKVRADAACTRLNNKVCNYKFTVCGIDKQ